MEYAPYNFSVELPTVDFDALPAQSFRQTLRRGIVESVKGNFSDGWKGQLTRLLARFRSVRERAFYGLVIDVCLPKGTGPHNALDLGCGSGWFMQKLQKVGWTVEGLEWNEEAARHARSATESNVWTGDFFNIDLPPRKYQLVVLNHVFEHFANPLDVLLRIYDLLSADGKAVLFFPNPESLGARWFGSRWFPWEIPRHLVLPSLRSMRDLSRKAGFKNSHTYARSDYTEIHWARSKAYIEGRHPETDPPNLDISEKFGVAVERATAAVGAGTGWEIVSILEK